MNMHEFFLSMDSSKDVFMAFAEWESHEAQ